MSTKSRLVSSLTPLGLPRLSRLATELLHPVGVLGVHEHGASLGGVDIRGLDITTVGPCQFILESIRRPDEDSVCPAETLDDFVLATTASDIGRVIAVLLKHDTNVLVGKALELRSLRG